MKKIILVLVLLAIWCGIDLAATPIEGCTGSLSLSLNPDRLNQSDVQHTVTALVFGLSNCDGKPFIVSDKDQKSGCQGVISRGGGTCTFRYTPLVAGTHIFYAGVDKNGDGNYNQQGEIANATLIIESKPCFITNCNDCISKDLCTKILQFSLYLKSIKDSSDTYIKAAQDLLPTIADDDLKTELIRFINYTQQLSDKLGEMIEFLSTVNLNHPEENDVKEFNEYMSQLKILYNQTLNQLNVVSCLMQTTCEDKVYYKFRWEDGKCTYIQTPVECCTDEDCLTGTGTCNENYQCIYGEIECGNNICESGECDSCPQDCEPIKALPPDLSPDAEKWYIDTNKWLDEKLIEWKPTPSEAQWPVKFVGFHLPTIAKELFLATNSTDDLKHLDMLAELNVDIICIWMSAPEDYPQDQLARIDALINAIRSREMKVNIWYDGWASTKEEYHAKAVRAAKYIISTWHPDYYTIIHEPSIRMGHQGWYMSRNEWKTHVEIICNLAKSLDSDVITTATVYNNQYDINYIDYFVQVSSLDIVGFDIYDRWGLDNGEIEQKINLIRDARKKVSIEETWPEPDNRFEGRYDPERAWWDSRWTRVITYFAQKHKVELVEPFYSTQFILYPGYMAASEDNKPIPQYIHDFKTDLAEGRRTPTFCAYKKVIEEVKSCVPECGNGICESGEDGFNCPEDCCVSGDGICPTGCSSENDGDCKSDCYFIVEDDTLIVGNSLIEITFDKTTGCITGLLNKVTDRQYLAGSEARNFVIGLSTSTDIWTAYDTTVNLIHGSNQTVSGFDKVDLPGGGKEVRIWFDNLYLSGNPLLISVTIRAQVKPNDALTYWFIDVTNDNEGVVRNVLFPVISGITDFGSEDCLAIPHMAGGKVRNPITVFTQENEVLSISYPVPASMQFIDYYNSNQGLYMASYDSNLSYTQLGFGASNYLGTMFIVKYPFVSHASSWSSPPFTVGIHSGDWHWASDQYREWLETWIIKPDIPESIQRMNGWIGLPMNDFDNVIKYVYDELPSIYEQAFGLTGFKFLELGFWFDDHYYTDFQPNSGMGGASALTKAIDDIHALGGVVHLYATGRLLMEDSDIYKTDGIAWQAMPEGKPNYEIWPKPPGSYSDRYVVMCPYTKGWQNYVRDFLVRFAEEYHADGAQVDQVSCATSLLCHDSTHGHSSPSTAWGEGYIELLKTAREAYRSVNGEFFLWPEGVNDAFSQYMDFSLGRCSKEVLSWAIPVPAEPMPELIRYTIPWIKVAAYDLPDMVKWGFVLGEPIAHPPVSNDLKKVCNIYNAGDEYFHYGTFMDDIGLTTSSPNLMAKVIKGSGGLAVTLWNRASSTHYSISIDLEELNMSKEVLGVYDIATGLPIPFNQNGVIITFEVDIADKDIKAIEVKIANVSECGNQICESGEDGHNCPQDCCVSGDGICRDGCTSENDDDCEEGDLSKVKVGVIYCWVSDGEQINRSIDDIVHIFQETETDFILTGWYRFLPVPESPETVLPYPFPQDYVEDSAKKGYTYEQLKQAINAIKKEDIMFCGTVPAYIITRLAWDPITHEYLGTEETWGMALDPEKLGVSMSKEQFQCAFVKRHSLIDPEFNCNYYDHSKVDYYFADITNEEFQKLLLSWVKKQIDCGADVIGVDVIYGQAIFLRSILVNNGMSESEANSHPAIKASIEAASKLVDEIHGYGSLTGKRVYVGTWASSIDFPHRQPDLDFFAVSPSSDEIKQMTLDEKKWDIKIDEIKKNLGDIPIFAFLDWESGDESPLAVFSQNLSPLEQREFLQIVDEFFQKKGINFIYIVHGGNMGVNAKRLSFGKFKFYDSLAPEFQTYETIKELAQDKNNI